MATTNKCFNLGLGGEQGIGFSENTGSAWVFPNAGNGTLKIYDVNKQPRHLVLDADGYWYDISTRNVASSFGSIESWKDKIGISNTGGTDIVPEVTFKEDIGEYERFVIEHLSSRIHIRPYNATSGYLSGTKFNLQIFENGAPTIPKSTTSNFNKTNEILFDRKAEANRLQSKLTATTSFIEIVGRQQDYIVKDISYTPDDRINTEDTHQSNLSDCYLWVTRGSTSDRVSGVAASGITANAIGPDLKSNSAFSITTAAHMPTIATSTPFTIYYWRSGNVNVSGNSSNITSQISLYKSSGSWNLMSGNISGTIFSFYPSGSNSKIYSIRVCKYSSSINTNDVCEYLFDDITENSGNNVEPIF